MTQKEIKPMIERDINAQNHHPGREPLLDLLEQRYQSGLEEYGIPLRTGDKHNWLQHLIEELVDSCQYIRGALEEMEMEGCDRAHLQRIYSTLIEASLAIAEMQQKDHVKDV